MNKNGGRIQKPNSLPGLFAVELPPMAFINWQNNHHFWRAEIAGGNAAKEPKNHLKFA